MKIWTVKCKSYDGKSKSFCSIQAAERFILSLDKENTREAIGYSPESVYFDVFNYLVQSSEKELALRFAKEIFRIALEETELIGHVMD